MPVQLKEITLPSTPATYAQEFFAAVAAANDPSKTYVYEVAGANLSNIRSAAFHQGEKLNTHFRVVELPAATKQGFNLAVSINPNPIVRRPRTNKGPVPAEAPAAPEAEVVENQGSETAETEVEPREGISYINSY